MMKSLHFCRQTSLAFALLLAAPLAAADSIRELKPISLDVTASSPGMESVVPFIIERDTNSDGYPDVFYVEFRVFAGDTSSFLYKSSGRSVTFPAPSCANPTWYDTHTTQRVLHHTASTRVFLGVALEVECVGADLVRRETSKTLLFSANLGVPGDAGWAYAASRNLAALDYAPAGPDRIVLSMQYAIDPGNAAGARNAVTRILNAADGSLVSEATHAVFSQ